jgi:hypothetical protein
MAASLDHANERIVALERENKILREELAILKQGLFGRRTERLDPGQLNLYLSGAMAENAGLRFRTHAIYFHSAYADSSCIHDTP